VFVGTQNLVGRLVALDVSAVAPWLELLDAIIVRVQLLVDEAVCIGSDDASHRRVVHDSQVIEYLGRLGRVLKTRVSSHLRRTTFIATYLLLVSHGALRPAS
jgi:hypothetical protein